MKLLALLAVLLISEVASASTFRVMLHRSKVKGADDMQFKSLSTASSQSGSSAAVPIITTSPSTGLPSITDDTDLSLPANPTTAFNNMKNIMHEVEQAFLVLVNEFQKIKSAGDSRSHAVEAKSKELEYRRRIMEKLQIDFEGERKAIKEQEEKLRREETILEQSEDENTRLQTEEEKNKERAQNEAKALTELQQKQKAEAEAWKNKETDLKTRFNLQTEALQKAHKELQAISAELDYARRVVEKEEIDYQTEKTKIKEQEEELHSKQSKTKDEEDRVKQAQMTIQTLEKEETDAQRGRDAEEAQMTAEIAREEQVLQDDQRKLQENSEEIKGQEQTIADDASKITQLQQSIRDSDAKKQAAAEEAETRVASVEQRYQLELRRKQLNYEYDVNQKQHEIDAIRIQVTHQSQEISNLQSQIDNWKALHTTADKVSAPVCPAKTCPCSCVN